MFLRNLFGKSHSSIFVKIIVLVLICTLLINFYLFYNLKTVSYLQNTVNILKTKEVRFEEDGKSARIPHPSRACKVANYSTYISDLLLQLKEDLEDYYLNGSRSTILQLRCMKFLSKERYLGKKELLLTDDKIDFTSNALTNILKESRILKVRNAPKGTQLKLLAFLSSNITAIFKPQWYSPGEIITGLVYSGKDRHYGEVVAFYLSILLNLRRVPPAVIRSLDVKKEIMPISNQKLLDTFRLHGNETCFFGVCHYCSPQDLLCSNGGRLEGSLIYYLSLTYPLKSMRHPWRRTYRCTSVAQWEIDENYCSIIRNSSFYSNLSNKALFLDLIDVAIFDFLIDNGDRHQFEYTTNLKVPRLLIMDNGKSFGNPYIDHIDILAPLYQCCLLRETTWSNLLLLRGGDLSKWLKFLLERSDGEIQFNELHYQALYRRHLLIFAAVKYCFQKFGMENVLVLG